ncbi:XRE family transcriptional regulator [Exilibacterium tricleocarpae]|uniref:XRE family transcriptional regulator n=1 Tax=Exilibacterium tricleocarpae TaxID=2591008 RepID=A0A545U9W6_9GAMM|nr:XRE family transcriptional regulator [Exilibacterium tricleocarpae]TQV86267.1 XRE family transcriptional regulator [Exilibacterium tricleocarpae]
MRESIQREFADNLGLLCSFYPSVTEVCRRLKINRSQFNKYLGAAAFPARHTLRKICDFFGVEEYEILLPAHQFRQLLQVRPSKLTSTAPLFSDHIGQLQRASSGAIANYAGFYFEYYYAMTYPSSILRTLVSLTWDGETARFSRLERLPRENGSGRGPSRRYHGAAFYLAERLFLLDYDSLTQNEISQTILLPTYNNRTTYLTGLKLGVTAQSLRLPTCARVVYEVLGANINLRAALRLCGLFDRESDAVAADVKRLIDNTAPSGDHHFAAVTV